MSSEGRAASGWAERTVYTFLLGSDDQLFPFI